MVKIKYRIIITRIYIVASAVINYRRLVLYIDLLKSLPCCLFTMSGVEQERKKETAYRTENVKKKREK